MEKLIYRNALNQELEFSAKSPYILQTMGESTSNKIVTTDNSNMDGELYESSVLSTRDIRLGIVIVNRTDYNRIRLTQRLLSVLNPKAPGKLIYRTDYGTKEIDVQLDDIPAPKRGVGKTEFEINFEALDPYWRNEMKTEHLAMKQNLLTFPLVIPKDTGMMFGLRQSILETPVNNVGDVTAGFKVIFRAKGYVKNPEIEHKYTGKKLKILVEMQKDDLLEIVNTTQRKMIYLNGEKAFKYLDRNNDDFFNLEVGTNLIGYTAEENAVNLDVALYYSPLFLGRD